LRTVAGDEAGFCVFACKRGASTVLGKTWLRGVC
jgi:hypothetical protein